MGYLATFIYRVSPIFCIPLPSWIWPKIWYFGFRWADIACNAFDPPFLLLLALSKIPKGGQWVISISTCLGTLLHNISSSSGLYWNAVLQYNRV